jgi:hypothetical protein
MSDHRWARILVPAVVTALVLGADSPLVAPKAYAAGPSVSITACAPVQFCVNASTFGTGSIVTVAGSGFGAGTSVIVWLDTNGNARFDNKEPSVEFLTDGSGNFSAGLEINEVPVGAYMIQAGTVHNPTVGEASVPVTVDLSANPTRFGSGSFVTVTGYGFTPMSPLNVWFDRDNDATLDASDNSVSVTTGPQGNFSTLIQALGDPGLWRFNAGPSSSATAAALADIGTCLVQECLITAANGVVTDTVCMFGRSPTDFLMYFGLCKGVDANYSATGYDLTNFGPRFPGAGALAAMTNDILPPPTGCGAILAAITLATAYGNTVPDAGLDLLKPISDLTDIACGVPDPFAPLPPVDLVAYEGEVLFFAQDSVPDLPILLALVAAIQTAVAAAAAAVATAGAVGIAAGPVAVQAAITALAGIMDPGAAAALAGSIGATVVSLALTVPAIAAALVPLILGAVQQMIALGAVVGAIACGQVRYYCDGSDITAAVIGNPALQQWQIPLPFMQPPFAQPDSPNVCRPSVGATPMNGNCWGGIIGWGMPRCTNLDAPGSCEAAGPNGDYPMLPVPGSAGPNNILANPECVTGAVVGQSIGYDGDVSFDVYDPNTLNLLNYHNFLPGPGGTDPPNGMDIEIPRADRAQFMTKLAPLRVGMHVRVCGRHVADMHMLWNELHPVTSLTILLDATGQNFSATEGSAFTRTVATFTVPDLSAPATQFTANIDWGDGSSSAGTITGATGSFTVTGSHTYAEEGTRSVVTTIADSADANDTGAATSTATVADASLTGSARAVSAVEGSGFSGTVFSFTDANPNGAPGDFAASVSWGDGNTSTGTVAANASGGFDVTATHTYAEEGSFTVTTTVNDAGGSTTQGTGRATVADAPLTATGRSIVSLNPVSTVVASFTDADPGGAASDYTATINWGDGTAATTGTVAASGSGFTASGTHTYGVLGPYTITTQICDAGGSCASASSNAMVASFASGGAFVLGDTTVGPVASSTGKAVTFWGAQWAKNNALSGGAPSNFKGFEGQPPVPVCGGTWTTDPGGSSSTPATIPTYMAVVVSSSVVTNGSVISGDVVHIVFVKTDPGYGPLPSQPGTGTIVAVFC